MREKSFRIYWQTLDVLELGWEHWMIARQNKFVGALALVLSGFNALFVIGIFWVRSL